MRNVTFNVPCQVHQRKREKTKDNSQLSATHRTAPPFCCDSGMDKKYYSGAQDSGLLNNHNNNIAAENWAKATQHRHRHHEINIVTNNTK